MPVKSNRHGYYWLLSVSKICILSTAQLKVLMPCPLQVLQLGALIRTKQITSVELTSVFQQRLKM